MNFKKPAILISSVLMLGLSVVAIPQLSASAASLPATISCPGGGSYLIDENGVATNGGTCAGRLELDSRVIRVGLRAFQYAPITSLKLDSNLQQIYPFAFRGVLIQSLDLDNSLTTIGSSAFVSADITHLRLDDSLLYIEADSFLMRH